MSEWIAVLDDVILNRTVINCTEDAGVELDVIGATPRFLCHVSYASIVSEVIHSSIMSTSSRNFLKLLSVDL